MVTTATKLKLNIFFIFVSLPRDVMHKRGLCRHAVCVYVCVSVTFVSYVKTNKGIFEFFSPSGSQDTLVFFRAKRDGDIPTGTPITRALNAGGVGKKRYSGRISLHTGLQCCRPKPYESRSVKNKAATDGGKRREPSTHGGVHRPLFAQDDDKVFVTGSTLYAGDGGQSSPYTTPLVITPFSAAIGHRGREPGEYFC